MKWSIRVHDVSVECGRYMCHSVHTCRGQRTIWWSQFSLSIFSWVPEFELRFLGLWRKYLYLLSHFNAQIWKFQLLHRNVIELFAIIMYYVMLLNSFICSQSYFWKIPWDFQGTRSRCLNIDTDCVFLLNLSLLVSLFPVIYWLTVEKYMLALFPVFRRNFCLSPSSVTAAVGWL